MKDWQRVADAVRTARAKRRLGHHELGVSKQTIINLENAHQDEYRPATLRAVEHALGWPDETIELIAAGGPIPDTPEPEDRIAALDRKVDELTLLVRQLLERERP